MKIRSLLLGSIAAAGLSTGAYAADLGVLTSLDVCDALGLSGLTISSDTNCLQITGEVRYRFTWGDWRGENDLRDPAGNVIGYGDPRVKVLTSDAGPITFDYGDGYEDWRSRFDAWIKFVASSDSDFGKAQVHLKIKKVEITEADGSRMISGVSQAVGTTVLPILVRTVPGTGTAASNFALTNATVNVGAPSTTVGLNTYVGLGGSDTGGVIFDEAYVSIGDSTVIMAGKKGSIFNKGDDVPLNFLGLFNSEAVDTGVLDRDNLVSTGNSHAIQIVSDLGNGFSIAGGIERLNGTFYDSDKNTSVTSPGNKQTPTAVGVLSYKGDGISAHVSVAADGWAEGEITDWIVHSGFSGTFDNFKVVLAGAFDSTDYWNVLASASATFDMFTLAASFEATADDTWGAGGSIGAKVTDGISINVGGRYYLDTSGFDNYQVAAQVVAAVTETITLTGEVGYVDDGVRDLFYGKGKLAWAPGGDYTASIEGTVNSDDAYKIATDFKKTFQ